MLMNKIRSIKKKFAYNLLQKPSKRQTLFTIKLSSFLNLTIKVIIKTIVMFIVIFT